MTKPDRLYCMIAGFAGSNQMASSPQLTRYATGKILAALDSTSRGSPETSMPQSRPFWCSTATCTSFAASGAVYVQQLSAHRALQGQSAGPKRGKGYLSRLFLLLPGAPGVLTSPLTSGHDANNQIKSSWAQDKATASSTVLHRSKLSQGTPAGPDRQTQRSLTGRRQIQRSAAA